MESVRAQTVACELVVERDPERTGCGPTLNRALAKVTTRWVATLGDDDTLTPDFAEQIQDQDADLLVFQMCYANGTVLPTVTDPADLHFGGVGCSYAVKTDVARRIRWIAEPCTPTLAEDWEMIRAVRDSGGIVRVIPRVVYRVRH